MTRDPYTVSAEHHDAATGVHTVTETCRCGQQYHGHSDSYETTRKALLAWRRSHDCTTRRSR